MSPVDAASALATSPHAAPRTPAPDLSLLDLIELEIGFDTLQDQYYLPVDLQRELDGARAGMLEYLRKIGIAHPAVARMHARSDGRGAVPALNQQVAEAIVRYGNPVEPRALIYAAIRGEVASLGDPYSVFFTPPEVKKFTTALDGQSFGGIGVVIAFSDADKTWHVEEVFDGGPAARAGMLAGDEIAAVDGKPLAGLSGEEARGLLRGKIGTMLSVSVVRAGVALSAPLQITRAAVSPPDVSAHMLPGSVGYVALRSFGLQAGQHVRAAVVRLESQGALALVFDLRNNGGGYESAAVGVGSVFVPGGPIVSVQEKRGKRVVTNADGKAPPARPLAVLVNGDSASGSELVAAAIQDRHAGTIVGTRTFGKGLVQTVVPLPDGSAVKLTTARYFTPAGRNIDRIGVAPDVQVPEQLDAALGVPGKDAQLDRALLLLQQPTPG